MPRTKDSPNKNRVFLLNRMKDMLGEDFNPVVSMCQNANNLQALVDQEIQANPTPATNEELSRVVGLIKNANEQWEKVAPYFASKAKPVDLEDLDKTNDAGVLRVEWQKPS